MPQHYRILSGDIEITVCGVETALLLIGLLLERDEIVLAHVELSDRCPDDVDAISADTWPLLRLFFALGTKKPLL